MKQLLWGIVVLGVASYLVVATGFHKTLYSMVTGEYAKDVRSSYGATVR